MGELRTIEAAYEYLRQGRSVIPIPAGEKAPRIPNWPNLQIREQELSEYFRDGSNIGILLGSASNGLVDVDLDSPEARKLASAFLPPTGLIHGRAGSRASHYWFHTAQPPQPRKFADADGKVILELRSNGQQTVVPPSIHPSGELITWERDGKPADIEPQLLVAYVSELAAGALLVRNWPKSGSRHEASLALAGLFLSSGWSQEKVVHFVGAVATAAGDEEARERVNSVISTAKRIASGQQATGGRTLASLIGDGVVARIRKWLDLNRPSAAANGLSWLAPEPLANELLPVPPFDLEFLPNSLRTFVTDISDRMQTPLDYAAASAIVALSGVVGRRAYVYPKVADDSWTVIPNLWGGIVAPPGMMKSPVMHAITQTLYRIEENWRTEYESELSGFEELKEQAELRMQAYREQYKSATKKGETLPIRPDTSQTSPSQKRLVLTDSTVEKLHEILAQNSAGVFVLRDELTGLLSQMEQPGRESERAFYLQAWNGNAGFTVDRIGRGSIHVHAVCISLLGNIQPARLRWYLAQTVDGGPNDDGLFQRFQLLVWPDLPQTWRLVDRPPNITALAQAERIYDTLANLSADDPTQLRFAPDGQQLFFEWLSDLEGKVRDPGLAPSIASHLAKYRSLMPSLAGLFSLADAVAGSEILTGNLMISLDHAKQSAALCKYLEAHARRIYACVASPELWAARELGRHIQAGDLPDVFTTRSVYLRGWTGLDGPERTRGALARLEDAGWVRRLENLPTGKGRPSEEWQISPRVVRHVK